MSRQDGRKVDFREVDDIEDLRDYFDSASDMGMLEKYRTQIEETNDLEKLRPVLEKESPVFLPGFD